MSNYIDQKISIKLLLRFALPSVLSMIFTSIYTSIDGMFVSRLISTNALSAINIVWPIITISYALGAMMGSGGAAIVAKKFGEKKDQEARSNFTLVVVFTLLFSLLIVGLCFIFFNNIIAFLGADKTLLNYCNEYAKYSLYFFSFSTLSFVFNIFFITSGRANLGLIISLIGGVINILFDYILMGVLKIGIKGAAIATGLGYFSTVLISLIYFSIKKENKLYFGKLIFDKNVLFKTMTNGSSELVTNIANGITTLMLNNILMDLAGANGVASITIILYAQSILVSFYYGFMMGISPLISFNYGKQEHQRLKKINKISLIIIGSISLITLLIAVVFSKNLVNLFLDNSSGNQEVLDMATYGFIIFAISFLFMGFNIYASSFFTALNNGLISALISFLRTFGFMVLFIIVLPLFFNLDGVWISIPLAEFFTFIIALPCLIIYKKHYHY